MGVRFASASSTFLTTTIAGTFPTAVPFAFGIWFRINTAGAAQTVWCLHQTATTGFNVMRFALTAANALQLFMDSTGSGPFTLTLTAGYTQGKWCHAIVRAISATNYRASVYCPEDNKFVAASSVSSFTLSTIGQMSLGKQHYNSEAANNLNGDVADFWWTDADFAPVATADLALVNHAGIAFGQIMDTPAIVKKLRLYDALHGWPGNRAYPDLQPARGRPRGWDWTRSATYPTGINMPPWVWSPSAQRVSLRRALRGKPPAAARATRPVMALQAVNRAGGY